MSQSEDPRKRAEEYHAGEEHAGEDHQKHGGKPSSQPARKTPRSLDQWATAASESIEEAMRDGAFDNLPGKGKPLNLGKDPFIPNDSALAFDILKNNDLAPGWLQQKNEMVREIEKWRGTLREIVAQANSVHAHAATEEARQQFATRWQTQRRSLQTQVIEFNKRIGTVNLQLPSTVIEIFKLRLDEEIAKAGATFPFGEA